MDSVVDSVVDSDVDSLVLSEVDSEDDALSELEADELSLLDSDEESDGEVSGTGVGEHPGILPSAGFATRSLRDSVTVPLYASPKL